MFPTFCLLHPVSPEYVAGKKARGLCRTYRCRRPKYWDRDRCTTCNCRLRRLLHPEHYAYENLRRSAKKRGIGFHLTFAEFKTFIAGSDYLTHKGTEAHSLTIDRRFTDQPYRAGNLRFMSHADNSSHRYEEKSDPSAPADY